MSRIDSLTEVKRGTGVTCQCGKSARITARGQTLCYECFDEDMRYALTLAVMLTNKHANVYANLIERDICRF